MSAAEELCYGRGTCSCQRCTRDGVLSPHEAMKAALEPVFGEQTDATVEAVLDHLDDVQYRVMRDPRKEQRDLIES